MNISKGTRVIRTLASFPAGQTNQIGSVVDMSGFEGIQFIALFGALTNNQVTSLKVQQGNLSDGSDMTDLAGSLHAPLDTADAGKCLVTEVFRPQKRYVRCVVTRNTANAVIDGVIAIQYSARVQPVTQDATVKSTRLLISPEEGAA